MQLPSEAQPWPSFQQQTKAWIVRYISRHQHLALFLPPLCHFRGCQSPRRQIRGCCRQYKHHQVPLPMKSSPPTLGNGADANEKPKSKLNMYQLQLCQQIHLAQSKQRCSNPDVDPSTSLPHPSQLLLLPPARPIQYIQPISMSSPFSIPSLAPPSNIATSSKETTPTYGKQAGATNTAA